MNILYVSYDGALDPLGSSQILPYIVNLSGRGLNMSLLSYEKKERLSRRDQVERVRKLLSPSGVEWRMLLYHKCPAIPATLYDICAGLIKGFFIVRRRKINVVHARSFIGAIPAFLLAKAFGLKFIFDMRGLWADEKVDAGDWKKDGIVYRVIKYIERIFLRHADAIIVLSDSARILLEKEFRVENRIHVIPTCADLGLFRIKDRDARFAPAVVTNKRFLFVYSGSLGSWYMHKEMADFIKAAGAVFDAPMLLLLTNTDPGMANSFMRGKGVPASDYVIRSVDHRDVPDYLNDADAALFFIKPLFSKRVSCPTKFGESLACGIPVVTNPGVGDIEGITRRERVGAVIEDFSDSAYKKAAYELQQLLRDGESLRKRCRQTAEKYFSLEKGTDKYQSIYERILRNEDPVLGPLSA